MRGRLIAREAPGLVPKLTGRTRAQRARVLAVMADSKREEFELAIDLAPKDTTYMASQTQSESTHNGFGYITGYRAEDFIGQTNPVTEKVITTFYPPIVHDGTKERAGNPWLSNARRIMRPKVRKRVRDALSVGG